MGLDVCNLSWVQYATTSFAGAGATPSHWRSSTPTRLTGPTSQPTRTGSPRPTSRIIAPSTAAGSSFVARETQVSQPLEVLVWLASPTLKQIRAGKSDASYMCSIPYSRQHFCEAGNPGGCDSSIVRLLACDSSEKVSVGPGWHVASFSATCWRGSADISGGFAVTPFMHHSACTQTVFFPAQGRLIMHLAALFALLTHRLITARSSFRPVRGPI